MALASRSLIDSKNLGEFSDILARSEFEDGITYDQMMIIGMMHGILEYAPHRVDALLDPSATTIERRTIELPLSGEVELAVVRPYRIRGTRQSMDLLENAVREAEKLMDAPWPYSINAVWLLFEHDSGGSAGSHRTTHITVRPKYDSDDGFTPRLIAHEVAHYYWRENPSWLDEGMAELMASVIENKRGGIPVRATNEPCGVVRNIMAWESLAEQGESTHNCEYWLGEGLFLDLLQQFGKAAFWEGVHKLYAEGPQFGSVGIEDIRQAFGPESDSIISRWYGE